MPQEWIYLLTATICMCAGVSVFVAVVWLRKLRETVASALSEAAGQQIKTAQRMGESIAQLQKQQDGYTHQINVLAQAGIRLQQELSSVSNRLENAQVESPRGTNTLH